MGSLDLEDDLVWSLLSGTVKSDSQSDYESQVFLHRTHEHDDPSEIHDHSESSALDVSGEIDMEFSNQGLENSVGAERPTSLYVQISSEHSADVCSENDQGSQSFSVHLSSANEASVRCAMRMPVVIRLYGFEGELLCDTGRLDFNDEDWYCLKNMSVAKPDGTEQHSKLLTSTHEFANGWAISFDVVEKRGCDSVLRSVHLMKSTIASYNSDSVPSMNASQKQTTNSSEQSRSDQGIFDCTEEGAFDNFRISFQTLSTRKPRTHANQALRQFVLGRDSDLPVWLLQESLWLSMSSGLTIQPCKSLHIKSGVANEELKNARMELEKVGYTILQETCWTDVLGAETALDSLAQTMDNLQKHGFPPVFIFMYDQAWQMFAHLFDSMACILGNRNVVMDASVFAWALNAGGHSGKVGSNFGRPHRDNNYSDCHTRDGHISLVTVWIPVVPVTTNSGCMYVVPALYDTFFAKPADPLHMSPDKHMPWPYIRALPAAAGDVLLWPGNLIHWGSSCDENVVVPRRSIGTAFMLLEESHKANREVITLAELQAGMSLTARLKFISRSLLLYEHWHPGFDGLHALGEAKSK